MYQRRVLYTLSYSICALNEAVYRHLRLAASGIVCARDSMALLVEVS